MFFRKKTTNEEEHCPHCSSGVTSKFSFCPYCGESLMDEAEEARNFGMLGRNDMADEEFMQQAFASSLGITDKLIGTIMQSMMKNLEVQVHSSMHDGTEVKNMGNGVRIKLGQPQQKKVQQKLVNRQFSDQQLERISTLTRIQAKSKVKRLSDKVVYELTAPDIASPNDVFVSKLESGYEIKAIGKSKLYVNSIPFNLPLRGFSLNEKGLIVEFSLR